MRRRTVVVVASEVGKIVRSIVLFGIVSACEDWPAEPGLQHSPPCDARADRHRMTFTAAGGAIATHRYGVLYSGTSASDKLVGYVDRGSSATIADGNSRTWDVGAKRLVYFDHSVKKLRIRGFRGLP